MTDNSYYDRLVQHYGIDPDRRMEVWATCPHCGTQGDTRAATGYSFSPRGYKCFVCGESGSLKRLAEIVLNAAPATYVRVERPAKPKEPEKPPDWRVRGWQLVEKFESHPEKVALWDEYKLIPMGDIIRLRLGVGILPQSRCNHPRLIVPLFRDGEVVWFRGRSIGCNCAKWMSSGGGRLADCDPYNSDRLGHGQVIIVTENPIDAVLIAPALAGNAVGIATMSVSYWVPRWTQILSAARPESIIVAYDNDLPGNGGARSRKMLEDKWIVRHQNAAPPMPGGVRLVNRLRDAGLPAFLYDWGDAAPGMDIGKALSLGVSI